MKITMKQYSDSKAAFYRKHSDERGYREFSELEGERNYKEVYFPDCHVWHEVTEPVIETVEVEVHGIKVKTQVKLYRTEIWDTENSASRYLYEADIA